MARRKAPKLLEASALARIARLELRARTAIEGYYSGIHKSPYHGSSVEFAEFREYEPGDDIRRIDWRVYAKTDRYFVKEFEAETNANVYLLVDCSGSMGFSTTEHSRLEYAVGLAAALALLGIRQGDQVGLMAFDEEIRTFVPPRSSARHFRVLSERLAGVKPGGRTDLAGIFHKASERFRRRSMIVVLSDLLGDSDAIARGFQHMRHRKHEVIVLHLVDDAEVDFPYERPTLFEDMETRAEIVVDPRVVRDAYQARAGAHVEALRKGCLEKRVDYEQMRLSNPFDRALTAYLSRRAHR